MQDQDYGDYDAPKIRLPRPKRGRSKRRGKGAPPPTPEFDIRAAADEELGGGKTTGAAPSEEPRTAVIVVHGMGQQLTFQTLDQVVNGVQKEHKRRRGDAQSAMSQVDILHPEGAGDMLVPRATLRLDPTKDAAPDQQVGVDFFECYWAPLTQGRIGIKAVMGFLLDAGRNGRKNAKRGLHQQMFGRDISLSTTPGTARWLLGAVFCIAGLILINAVTTAIAAVELFSKTAPTWFSESLVCYVTWTVILLLAWLVLSTALMFLLKSMFWFRLLYQGLIAGSLALVYVLAAHKFGWWIPPAMTLPSIVTLLVWATLLIASWFTRDLLVQYVGDVAIYVQPHKLGMFSKLRADIKASARKIADVVYARTDENGEPQYQRVLVVGHSLGSVVAYDMLNDQMVRDMADGGERRIAERTRLLLTFGSPLDKITFIFRSQGRARQWTRESLAAARQPLIFSYDNRKHMRWINVYSPKDIISGPLDYFDDPDDAAHEPLHVQNLEDPQCETPLAAHVQYWNNQLVFEKLYDALVTDVAAPPRASGVS